MALLNYLMCSLSCCVTSHRESRVMQKTREGLLSWVQRSTFWITLAELLPQGRTKTNHERRNVTESRSQQIVRWRTKRYCLQTGLYYDQVIIYIFLTRIIFWYSSIPITITINNLYKLESPLNAPQTQRHKGPFKPITQLKLPLFPPSNLLHSSTLTTQIQVTSSPELMSLASPLSSWSFVE